MPAADLPSAVSASPGLEGPGLRVRENERYLVVELAGDILFDFDRSAIRPDAEAVLRRVLPVLTQRFAAAPVEVDGHTDAMGSDDYNIALGRRRAEAVRAWLAGHGVAPARISGFSFGKRRPVAANAHPDGSDDPAGRQRNRRVELIVRKAGP